MKEQLLLDVASVGEEHTGKIRTEHRGFLKESLVSGLEGHSERIYKGPRNIFIHLSPSDLMNLNLKIHVCHVKSQKSDFKTFWKKYRIISLNGMNASFIGHGDSILLF